MTAAENAATLRGVIDEIHADAELTGVKYDMGRKALKRNSDWPRIVWIPVGGSIQASQNVGARLANGQRLRAVRTDAVSFKVRCWHEDEECCKALLHALIAACWRVAKVSAEFGSYDWLTQDEGADYARRGEVIEADVSLLVPVLEQDPTRTRLLTTLTAQGHTTSFESDLDGSLEVVC
jgi:hypothetical protein